MGARIAFGSLPYDMAHMLGGAMLVLSFALLYQRRLSAVINIYAMQGVVLAVAASWQGYIQASPQLYLTAAIAFAAKAISAVTYRCGEACIYPCQHAAAASTTPCSA